MIEPKKLTVGFLMTVITSACLQGCYSSWDEITYLKACDPLAPEVECGPHQRCLPRTDKDPVCEGPVSFDKPQQDQFCSDNEDCSTDEICMAMDEHLPSKICMRFCRDANDCPTDYTCSKVGVHQMEIRGEEWGVCFTVTPPPTGWHCDAGYYAGAVGGNDNQCDCDCDLFDPDCEDNNRESCEMCNKGGVRTPCGS